MHSDVGNSVIWQEGLYGWTDGTNGVYLAALGFSMIPVTIAMGAIASRVNDRVLTVFSMTLTLVGCLQIMNGGYPRCATFSRVHVSAVSVTERLLLRPVAALELSFM